MSFIDKKEEEGEELRMVFNYILIIFKLIRHIVNKQTDKQLYIWYALTVERNKSHLWKQWKKEGKERESLCKIGLRML